MIKLTLASNGESILVNKKEIFNVLDRKEKGSEIFFINVQGSDLVKETLEEIETLILRDQFAMSALQGLLADTHRDNTTAEVCYASYEIADAMLKARKAKQ